MTDSLIIKRMIIEENKYLRLMREARTKEQQDLNLGYARRKRKEINKIYSALKAKSKTFTRAV